MQGVGKFVTSSTQFHTIQGPIHSDKEKKLYAWKKVIDDELEDIYKKLKKTSCHSDVGSSNYSTYKAIDGDDCLEENVSFSILVKVIYHFVVLFGLPIVFIIIIKSDFLLLTSFFCYLESVTLDDWKFIINTLLFCLY